MFFNVYFLIIISYFDLKPLHRGHCIVTSSAFEVCSVTAPPGGGSKYYHIAVKKTRANHLGLSIYFSRAFFSWFTFCMALRFCLDFIQPPPLQVFLFLCNLQ